MNFGEVMIILMKCALFGGIPYFVKIQFSWNSSSSWNSRSFYEFLNFGPASPAPSDPRPGGEVRGGMGRGEGDFSVTISGSYGWGLNIDGTQTEFLAVLQSAIWSNLV